MTEHRISFRTVYSNCRTGDILEGSPFKLKVLKILASEHYEVIVIGPWWSRHKGKTGRLSRSLTQAGGQNRLTLP